MDSLKGQLLLASPALFDPNFRRTVVLVTEHNEEGAAGLVLNRRSETAVAEAVPDLQQLVGDEELVYVGGPVQQEAVLVLAEFDDPEEAAMLVVDDVGFLPGDGDFGLLADDAPRARLRRVRGLGARPARGRAGGVVVDRRAGRRARPLPRARLTTSGAACCAARAASTASSL